MAAGDPVAPRRGRGAPKGNRNALKHGRYTAEKLALREERRAVLRRVRRFQFHVDLVLAQYRT